MTLTAPQTTEAYRQLYDEASIQVLMRDKSEFVDIIMNGLREHLDRFVEVMGLVRKYRPDTILDMPCGWGFFGGMFRWSRGYAPKYIVGADVGRAGLTFARDVMHYDEVYEVDLTNNWPMPRGKYEMVLCMELLEHVHDPVVVVKNALQASRGVVLFTTPNEEGDVDGVVHVRKVSLRALIDLVAGAAEELRLPIDILESYELTAQFTEKPHWKGWNFLVVGVAK